MPTIIRSALPVLLAGLLAGCAAGGGYYSSGGYGGGGYGYEQPYQPGGYYYAPSSYGYSFSYYGSGNDWRDRHQDHDYGGNSNWWHGSRQEHDVRRSYAVNHDQGHWQNQQNQSSWKKKNWGQ